MATKTKSTKTTEREAARKAERKRHKQYIHKGVGGVQVFGKTVKSRMVRVSAAYAMILKKKAGAAGLSIPEYTDKLAKK